MTPEQLVDHARSLIGAGFVHQGRSQYGVDCIGLVNAALKRGTGADLAVLCGFPENVSYSREPSPMLLEQTARICRRLERPVPGCVLLLKMPQAQHPHHLAIYTADGTIIHAEALRAKRVVEHTYGAPWTRFLHSVWALPGVDYSGHQRRE